jgi:hypothetical protein
MLKFNINKFCEIYFIGLLLFISLIIVELYMWMQNYDKVFSGCLYCQSYEVQRKAHDFIEFLPVWLLVVLPTALVYSLNFIKSSILKIKIWIAYNFQRIL